jgi:xanthine dehydrogenase accessory factor
MNRAALRLQAARWCEKQRPAVVVELRSVQGSVPREAGTRMLVAQDEVIGTIGGGHLEWMAMHTARELLAGRTPWPAPVRVALGPSLGQCCGGAVDLAYEPLNEDALRRWPVTPPASHLVLYGAGHVAQALIQILRGVDVSVDWVDSRDGAHGSWPDFPGLRCVVTDDPAYEAHHAPAGAHHLVMTHSHAQDFDIVLALLRRADTGMVGLIGSKTKRMQFEHRLLARGLSEGRVAQLVCPVGVAGVYSKAPAAVAVAVAAQLLSLPGCG